LKWKCLWSDLIQREAETETETETEAEAETETETEAEAETETVKRSRWAWLFQQLLQKLFLSIQIVINFLIQGRLG